MAAFGRPGSETRSVYSIVQRFLSRKPAGNDSARLIRAFVLLLLGLCVGTGAAASDTYLHRGIESGAEEPFVLQTTGREHAVNVDLRSFPQAQLEQIADVLQRNGYRYVRQTFAWNEIEPNRGGFTWEKYDTIVRTLESRGLQIVAVLHRSPDWARDPSQVGTVDAPPILPLDYASFVGQVVARYQGSVQYVQLWDRPNRGDQWGGVSATPAAYVRLLSEAFNASRTADSETKVVLAEFQPFFSDGTLGADVFYLKSIFRMGGGPFFDIATAQIDGGTSSPYDRRVAAGRLNMSRAILFREVLIDQGPSERQKPIWFTHFGWNATPDGGIDRDEQADFALAGIKRVRAEWPWVGLMFGWSLLPDPAEPDQFGYALLDSAGGSAPVFNALADHSRGGADLVASTGFVPMDSAPISYTGNWADQHLDRRTMRTTSEIGASTSIRFRGTGVTAFLRFSPEAGPVLATIDGLPIQGLPEQDGESLLDLTSFQAVDFPLEIASDLSDADHVLTLKLIDRGELTVGGVVISRDPPLLWPVIVLIAIAVFMVAFGLRDVAYVVALHSKALQRRDGVSVGPPLPHMPDFRPANRY